MCRHVVSEELHTAPSWNEDRPDRSRHSCTSTTLCCYLHLTPLSLSFSLNQHLKWASFAPIPRERAAPPSPSPRHGDEGHPPRWTRYGARGPRPPSLTSPPPRPPAPPSPGPREVRAALHVHLLASCTPVDRAALPSLGNSASSCLFALADVSGPPSWSGWFPADLSRVGPITTVFLICWADFILQRSAFEAFS